MKSDDPEFFIGWQGRAPPVTGRRLKRIASLLAGLALGIAGGAAALQRTIGPAKWDYANVREFTGLLVADPVPMLLTDAPEPGSGTSVFLLVRPNKFGFEPALAREHHLSVVRLRATLLHRESQAMLEVAPDGFALIAGSATRPDVPPAEDLGEHALTGEIVDGKCFLGAMNPGQLKPHRACAIRCLSGGIPPVLLVRDAAGRAVHYVLVGSAGEPVNHAVLDFVAEPVEVRGRVWRHAGHLVLRADPAGIRRLP